MLNVSVTIFVVLASGALHAADSNSCDSLRLQKREEILSSAQYKRSFELFSQANVFISPADKQALSDTSEPLAADILDANAPRPKRFEAAAKKVAAKIKGSLPKDFEQKSIETGVGEPMTLMQRNVGALEKESIIFDNGFLKTGVRMGGQDERNPLRKDKNIGSSVIVIEKNLSLVPRERSPRIKVIIQSAAGGVSEMALSEYVSKSIPACQAPDAPYAGGNYDSPFWNPEKTVSSKAPAPAASGKGTKEIKGTR